MGPRLFQGNLGEILFHLARWMSNKNLDDPCFDLEVGPLALGGGWVPSRIEVIGALGIYIQYITGKYNPSTK